MNENIYKDYIDSIQQIGDLKITEEEFQKKQEEFNTWLISLQDEERQQVVKNIIPILKNVINRIQDKQQNFKDLILANEGTMRANSQYDKY